MEVNMQIFPQLGAFKGEVGSGNSPGGINNNAMFPMGLPLNYYWNYGQRKKTRKTRKNLKRKSRKNLKRKSRKSRKSI